MIEDGNADLERIQHAHAVNLGEDVADHIGFGIDVEELVDGIFRGRLRKVAAENIAGIFAAVQDLAKIVREERSIALERGQKRKAVDVALLPGERNVVAEFAALQAVGQARKNAVAIKAARPAGDALEDLAIGVNAVAIEIGRASCSERVTTPG